MTENKQTKLITCEPPEVYAEMGELMFQFQRRNQLVLSEWARILCAMAASGPVALLGASSQEMIVALLLDPNRQLLHCLVDADPQKHGFLAGTGHPVISYECMQSYGIRSALLLDAKDIHETLSLFRQHQICVQLVLGGMLPALPATIPRVLKTEEELAKLAVFLAQEREYGKRLVLTAGVFDLLHVGHIQHLQSLQYIGDILIVAVDTDRAVKALKGATRPMYSQDDRIESVAALRCVDYTFLFDHDTLPDILRQLRPHVFIKGRGYEGKELFIDQTLREIACLRVVSPQPLTGRSTSETIRQIQQCTSER